MGTAKRYSFKRANEHVKDLRISICSNCRSGIFVGHEYKWSEKGLVHIDCKNKVGDVHALKDVS